MRIQSGLPALLLIFTLLCGPAIAADKYYDYGMSLMDKKQFKQAIGYFDASINTKGASVAQSWYRKGDCFEQLKDYKSALNCYEQVIRLAPASLEAKFAERRVLVMKAHLDPQSCVNIKANSCPVLKREIQEGKFARPQGQTQK